MMNPNEDLVKELSKKKFDKIVETGNADNLKAWLTENKDSHPELISKIYVERFNALLNKGPEQIAQPGSAIDDLKVIGLLYDSLDKSKALELNASIAQGKGYGENAAANIAIAISKDLASSDDKNFGKVIHDINLGVGKDNESPPPANWKSVGVSLQAQVRASNRAIDQAVDPSNIKPQIIGANRARGEGAALSSNSLPAQAKPQENSRQVEAPQVKPSLADLGSSKVQPEVILPKLDVPVENKAPDVKAQVPSNEKEADKNVESPQKDQEKEADKGIDPLNIEKVKEVPLAKNPVDEKLKEQPQPSKGLDTFESIKAISQSIEAGEKANLAKTLDLESLRDLDTNERKNAIKKHYLNKLGANENIQLSDEAKGVLNKKIDEIYNKAFDRNLEPLQTQPEFDNSIKNSVDQVLLQAYLSKNPDNGRVRNAEKLINRDNSEGKDGDNDERVKFNNRAVNAFENGKINHKDLNDAFEFENMSSQRKAARKLYKPLHTLSKVPENTANKFARSPAKNTAKLCAFMMAASVFIPGAFPVMTMVFGAVLALTAVAKGIETMAKNPIGKLILALPLAVLSIPNGIGYGIALAVGKLINRNDPEGFKKFKGKLDNSLLNPKPAFDALKNYDGKPKPVEMRSFDNKDNKSIKANNENLIKDKDNLKKAIANLKDPKVAEQILKDDKLKAQIQKIDPKLLEALEAKVKPPINKDPDLGKGKDEKQVVKGDEKGNDVSHKSDKKLAEGSPNAENLKKAEHLDPALPKTPIKDVDAKRDNLAGLDLAGTDVKKKLENLSPAVKEALDKEKANIGEVNKAAKDSKPLNDEEIKKRGSQIKDSGGRGI